MLEALFAMAILAILLAGLMPGFLVYADANTHNELRTGAVQAARKQLETLRLANPPDLPSSGSVGPEVLEVGGRSYDVLTRYCVVSALCDDVTRHLTVEISHDGREYYVAETVYTALR